MFQFRLARQMNCTHEELMNRMSYPELVQWVAFCNLEPADDGWITSAALLSMLSAIIGGKSLKYGDIYPHLATPMTMLELEARASVYAATTTKTRGKRKIK